MEKQGNVLLEENGIRYEYLTSECHDEAVKLITDIFNEHEPMLNMLNVPKNLFVPFFKAAHGGVSNNNLSVAAFDCESNQLIGVFACEDSTTMPTEEG